MAGSLFDSKIIQHEIVGKNKMIIDLYGQEVQAVKEIFESKLSEFERIGMKVTEQKKIFRFVSHRVSCIT